MELQDLVGSHVLTGVDFEDYSDDCHAINFILDDVTYSVIEDSENNYRSAMREAIISDKEISNIFRPVTVEGIMRDQLFDQLIDFIDVETGKIVLSVGTDNSVQYYPCFIAQFNPENMCINAMDFD